MMKKNSIYQSKKIIEERTSEAIGTAFTSIDIKQTGEDYEVQGIICRFKKVAKVTVTVNSNYEIKFWSLSGNTIEMVRSLIGEIDLGNIVSVSDPCYDRSIWCRTTLKDVMPGRWKVFACIDTLDSWGRRCYIIELYHESIQDSRIDENAWKTYSSVRTTMNPRDLKKGERLNILDCNEDEIPIYLVERCVDKNPLMTLMMEDYECYYRLVTEKAKETIQFAKQQISILSKVKDGELFMPMYRQEIKNIERIMLKHFPKRQWSVSQAA